MAAITVAVLTSGRRSIGDGSNTPRLMVGHVIGLAALTARQPSIARSRIGGQSPTSCKDAKHAGRPSDVSIVHDAAGQVLGGDVAATFGARQRDVGEGSPNGRTSQSTLVRRVGAESGHEEQNIPSQDLPRVLRRKEHTLRTLTRVFRKKYKC